jgi:AcrR family transcriptional regulator
MERNDARVLEAAINQLADVGWSGLGVSTVAKRAGVSQQTVQDRFHDRTALAIGTWQHALSDPLARTLQDLLHHHGLLGTPSPDAAATHRAWIALAQPSTTLRASLELLLSAPFQSELREAIEESLGARAAEWTDQGNTGTQRRLAAQRALLLGTALGLLMVGTIVDLTDVDLSPFFAAITHALANPARASRTHPEALRTSFDEPFDSGDERHDALLRATNRHIARVGFHDASIQAIVEEAGVTKGFLFARYPTKLALFTHATQRRSALALDGNIAWIAERSRRYGQGRAESLFVRAMQQPNSDEARRLLSEELRLTARIPELAASFRETHENVAATLGSVNPHTLGYAYGARALGEGLALLPYLLPNAWTLPFEITLIPLANELQRIYQAN